MKKKMSRDEWIVFFVQLIAAIVFIVLAHSWIKEGIKILYKYFGG